jgi:DNA-binding MarR family transcriptional regulator
MQEVLGAALSRQLSSASDLSLQDYGVLVALSESEQGSLRPFELGRALGVEKSRLSHQLARLVQRGLVTRHRCPTDQRGWLISITRSGRDALEEAAPGHVAAVRAAFVDRLTPTQLATLASIATAVLDGPAAACADGGDSCEGPVLPT